MKHTTCGSRHTTMALLLLAALSFAGCATVGREFDSAQVPAITIGKTTQQDLLTMFGTPWRTGIEDGRQTWTYGRYHYSLFKEASTKDLVVRFDDRGRVGSYSFNTTD